MKWLGLIHNPTVKMQEIHDRSEAEDSLKVGKKNVWDVLPHLKFRFQFLLFFLIGSFMPLSLFIMAFLNFYKETTVSV